MATLLGSVSGQIKIDVSQALAAYVAVQQANRDTINALRQMSSTLNTVGNAIGVVGLGLAAALGYAAKEAANFNAQMDYFQSISGATANQMDQIRQKALALDQTTMFSTQDIANMFVELAKAGEGTDQIVGGVADAVVNLAQAAQIPLNSAVTTVVSVLNAYNLSASQAAEVSDRLAGAANASILEVSDLATSLKYVSGVADQLGISFNETTTALDLLGQAGIKGSMGGTELRQILVSILGTTKPAAAELKQLGIITKDGANQFFDASGKAKSLSDIFQILQDHLRGLNQEQQLAALKTIFNNRALSAAAILTKAGADGFKQMNDAMSGTTAADVAAQRMDNLAGDTKKLTSSLKTMAIEAGQPLQNFLRQVVQGLTSLVHWFENLSPATQSNIIHILAITAAFLLASAALIKIVAFAIRFAETMKTLATVAKFLWSVLTIGVNVIRALSVALMANPIGLIIAAVVALAIAFFILYEKVKPVRDFFNAIGRGLKTAFEATVNWFKGLPDFFEHVWADIKQWFDDGVNGVKKAWDAVVNFFKGIGESIKNGIVGAYNAVINFFENLPGQVESWIDKVANSVANFFQNLPYKLGYWLGYALGAFIKWESDVVRDIGNWLLKMTINMGNFFQSLPGKLVNWLREAANAIATWINQVEQDVVDWLIQMGKDIGNFFINLPGNVWNWLVSVATNMKRFEDQAINDVVGWIERTSGSIANFFSSLPARIGGWLTSALTNMVNWVETMVQKANDLGQRVLAAIGNWFTQLPGNIRQIFDNAVSAIENAISDAFNAAANFAEGLWNGFKHGLGMHSPSYIEKAMFQITDTMYTETDKISDYVKQINGLGEQMMGLNPATAASAYSSILSNSLGSQIAMLQALKQLTGSSSTAGYGFSNSLFPGQVGVLGGTGNTPTKVLEVNVYNPVGEDSATSTTQQLRTLASMGAF